MSEAALISSAVAVLTTMGGAIGYVYRDIRKDATAREERYVEQQRSINDTAEKREALLMSHISKSDEHIARSDKALGEISISMQAISKDLQEVKADVQELKVKA